MTYTLKDKQTRSTIRELKYQQGMSNRAIGRLLGIPESTIRTYLRGETWNGEGKLQYNPEDVAFKQTNVEGFAEIIGKAKREGKISIKWSDVDEDNSRILLISDLHIPYHHPDSLAFLQYLKDKYKPTRVICGGDELDGHALSFHDSDPDLPSAGDELRLALPVIQELKKLFPVMDILESNHGSLLYRKAHANGIPRHYLKSYNEVLKVDEQWKWHYDMVIELPNNTKCYLHHGKSNNVTKTSQAMSMSAVQFHYHETFKVEYWANPLGLYWALQCGCLIDDKQYAFNYNNVNLKRPILGTGLIINSMPVLEPMVLDEDGRWIGK